jgi:hypothetical protein
MWDRGDKRIKGLGTATSISERQSQLMVRKRLMIIFRGGARNNHFLQSELPFLLVPSMKESSLSTHGD